VNYYIENFFPLHLSKGVLVFIKNIFCGLSLSLLLMLGFLGFLLLALLDKFRMRRFLPIVSIVTIGYIFIGIFFFLTYPKYPHYLGYLVVIFSSMFYFYIMKYISKGDWLVHILAAVIFTVGIISWGYNLWGHSLRDKSFENIRFLSPYYKSPIDRLARESALDKDRLKNELEELNQAQDFLDKNGGRILYMDFEPGLLIPSIVNRDYFRDVYFLKNFRSREIYTARTKKSLLKALKQNNIKFICIPGRSHGEFDYTVLLGLLKEHRGRYKYVIPVEELLQ